MEQHHKTECWEVNVPKLRSIVSFFLLILVLPYPGNAPVPFPIFRASENLDADRHFIIVNVDEITFLGPTGDVTGDGEFRLLMIGSDTKGHSTGLFCPGDKPMTVKQGKTVSDPCSFGLSFDEKKMSDSVVIMIMALDEDKSTAVTDIPYETAVSGLGEVLGKAVAQYAPKLNPYTFTLQALLSFSAGRIKNWIERADVVGSYTLHLTRQTNWSATGKPKKVTSSDGGIKLTYTITRSTSVPQGIATKTPRPQPSVSTKTPVAISTKRSTPTAPDNARIACDAGIIEVNMRKSPGYLGKDDTLDRVAKVPCGEYVEIIDGPQNKDGLRWWYVLWNGYKGWMADHTGKGRLILIFEE
jgi:hypothetical protein